MRCAILFCLALCVLGISGCSTGPGRSPSQIQAKYHSDGYVDRNFADMHPDLPG